MDTPLDPSLYNSTDGGTLVMFPPSGSLDVYSGVTTNASSFWSPSPGPDEQEANRGDTVLQLENQLQLTRFIVMRVLAPIIITIGVTGNVLNIAVLTRRSMRSSTNRYLTCLAVYDVLYLVFVFTLIIKHYVDVTTMKWYNYYKYHVGVPITNTCSNTGVWVTLTFTIERYIAVCYPIKGKALCTPERAKVIIMVVCAVAAILTFPDFLTKRVIVDKIEVQDGVNITYYKANSTEMAIHPLFSEGYNYLTQVLFTFLPLLLLMVFNSLLIRSVMIAAQERSRMAQAAVVRNERKERHHRDQTRITVMLITVVIVFLMCQMPQAIQNILLAYYSHNETLTEERRLLFTITANVFNLFVIFNSSANFVLYSAFSTKFRRTFSRLFCQCLHTRRGDSMFTEATSVAPNTKCHPDDSRSRLLQANNRKQKQLTFNWPRSGAPGAVTKTTNSDNTTRGFQEVSSDKNGYNSGLKISDTQSIVSCV